jgi:hypothetical protein
MSGEILDGWHRTKRKHPCQYPVIIGGTIIHHCQRQLTAGETSKLEAKEAAINLTAGERQQVNKEQNAVSRNIYNTKHNAKTQPGAKTKQSS